jgi:phosphatidylserine/phosphatidylglycerophosphate/cardiolipin synthase-like enzyme
VTKRIITPGRNVWRLAPVTRAGVLVDACDYYRAFYRAMSAARRYVLLSGWQFDSDVRLLRGEDARGAPWPVEFLPFLSALCRERPELRVYVLAWDYSVIYTLEREWMQRLKFDFGASDRIEYVLDGKHPVGACHHQKLVAVDGRLAFVGGADICDGRWDDRQHEQLNAERVNRYGEPYKPYHEVVAFITGDRAVASLEEDFKLRWRRARGVELRLPAPDRVAGSDEEQIEFEGALPLEATTTAIARTYATYEVAGSEAISEIRALYMDAIREAKAFVYIETQYITSRALHEALVARFCDESQPPLQVIIVVPRGGDTFKEELALGAAEEQLLASIERVAWDRGHLLRVLYSGPSDGSESSLPTFIHSKVLVVDDRFLSIGSANCTNRSFGLDSELNLVWETDERRGPLGRSIARLRASLLSEHAGIAHDERLMETDGLVQRLDALVEAGTRLRLRPTSSSESEPSSLLKLAFDSESPPLEAALDELTGASRLTSISAVAPHERRSR